MAALSVLTLLIACSVMVSYIYFGTEQIMTSAVRNRLWRFRAELHKRIRRGELPSDHPAVRELLDATNRRIYMVDHLTVLDFWAYRRSHKGTRQERLRIRQRPEVDGLDEEARSYVLHRRNLLDALTYANVFATSWVGLIFTFVRFCLPRGVIRGLGPSLQNRTSKPEEATAKEQLVVEVSSHPLVAEVDEAEASAAELQPRLPVSYSRRVV